MGRYYSGDIEGKFWFGVQDSNDASFFGGEELEPHFINYEFLESDLEEIREGLATCKKELRPHKTKMAKFFKSRETYSDEQLASELIMAPSKIASLLVWYARYTLGKKILKCVEKQGCCYFDAEL